MKILECHSYKPEGGDIRFSAFGAKLPDGRTIEEAYQGAKRDKNGKPFERPKGKKPEYFFLNGHLVPCTDHVRQEFYLMLWYVYLKNNPVLREYASQFTSFRDKYAWKGQVIDELDSYYQKEEGKGCNQAAAIAWLVGRQEIETPLHVLFDGEVYTALERYLRKYPFQNQDSPRRRQEAKAALDNLLALDKKGLQYLYEKNPYQILQLEARLKQAQELHRQLNPSPLDEIENLKNL